MSVLDMFASALGAFIMVAIILYPYYDKDLPKKVEAAKTEIEELVAKQETQKRELELVSDELLANEDRLRDVRAAVADRKSCSAELAICSMQLSRTFLFLQISWQTFNDVNLEVVDTEGRLFTWAKNNRNGRDYPQTKAQLSVDVAVGPGMEIWNEPDAQPGRYQLFYTSTRPVEGTTPVTAFYFTRYGRFSLPDVELKAGETKVAAAVVVIAPNGEVSIEGPGAGNAGSGN